MGSFGREREQWMEMESHTQQARAADSMPSDRRYRVRVRVIEKETEE